MFHVGLERSEMCFTSDGPRSGRDAELGRQAEKERKERKCEADVTLREKREGEG